MKIVVIKPNYSADPAWAQRRWCGLADSKQFWQALFPPAGCVYNIKDLCGISGWRRPAWVEQNPVKPFVVLLFFITFLLLFAGAAMGDSDLTPNTEPAQEGGGNLPSSVQGVRSGACTDPYVVRSGDTLSAIARLCAVSLAEIGRAHV